MLEVKRVPGNSPDHFNLSLHNHVGDKLLSFTATTVDRERLRAIRNEINAALGEEDPPLAIRHLADALRHFLDGLGGWPVYAGCAYADHPTKIEIQGHGSTERIRSGDLLRFVDAVPPRD